jgi:hypothetical protein
MYQGKCTCNSIRSSDFDPGCVTQKMRPFDRHPCSEPRSHSLGKQLGMRNSIHWRCHCNRCNTPSMRGKQIWGPGLRLGFAQGRRCSALLNVPAVLELNLMLHCNRSHTYKAWVLLRLKAPQFHCLPVTALHFILDTISEFDFFVFI